MLLGLLPHPCQSLGVETGSVFALPLMPGAIVLPRPLQHRQLTKPRRICTSRRIPWAVVLPRPL